MLDCLNQKVEIELEDGNVITGKVSLIKNREIAIYCNASKCMLTYENDDIVKVEVV